MQYLLPSAKPRINQLIEDSIFDAEKKGAKVIGLGILNMVLVNLISGVNLQSSFYLVKLGPV